MSYEPERCQRPSVHGDRYACGNLLPCSNDHQSAVLDPCEPNHWDARWDARQRADALALAEEAVADARSELDKIVREIDDYATIYKTALKWLASAAYFKASADARDITPDPDPVSKAR